MGKKVKIKKSTSTKKSSRSKYQAGGFADFLSNNPNAAGAVGSLGSSLIDTIDPGNEYGVKSTGGAIGGGALKGAATGAALGPIGALVGAGVGGLTGLIGNQKAKKRQTAAEERKKSLDMAKAMQESNAILASYDNKGTGITDFAHGGLMYSYPGVWKVNPLKYKKSPLSFQQGGLQAGNGNLLPVSDEAFEVKGDNPNATDDVEVEGAYVDHNEIIKPDADGLKIFSDTLKPPGSKLAFSKIAKKLEQQKSIDKKNSKQDELIEHKLEKLFNLQQMLNGNNQGESPEEAIQPAGEIPGIGMTKGNMFQQGGIMYPGISGSGITDEIEFFNLQNAHKKKKKSEYMHGGLSPISKSYHNITPEAASLNPGKYIGSKIMSFDQGGTFGEKIFEWGNYKKELSKEPGHAPGDATFKFGGKKYQVGGQADINLLTAETNPRGLLNQALMKQYPGVDLNILDMHNKEVNDHTITDEVRSNYAAVRRGYNPDGTPRYKGPQLISTLAQTRPTIPLNVINTTESKQLVTGDPFKHYPGSHKKKMNYQEGGLAIRPYDETLAPDKEITPDPFTKKNIFSNMNWNNALTTAGTLAPTFANMVAADRLPAVPDVHLNKAVKLQRPDFSDQRNDLKQGLRVATLAAGQNSVMGQAQTGQLGNATAEYFNSVNRMHGDINRINTDVSNRESTLNAQITAGNNALLDRYSQSKTARVTNQANLQSQNRADLANKIMGLAAQSNQKELDKQKAKMFEDYLNKIAPGIVERNTFLKAAKDEKPGIKKGGLLGYKPYRSGGKLKRVTC